jgi:hypothetical protein
MFAKVPDHEAQQIKEISKMLTYGWGVIPCTVTIGKTTEKTSLFPKDGGYLVPIKVALSKPEGLAIGQNIKITLSFEA